jgi:hypothetical protein
MRPRALATVMTAGLLLLAGPLIASAQTVTIHTPKGKPVPLWAISMNDEYCQYVPAPEIRIKQKPQHGRVQIVQVKLKNTGRNNNCFGTEAHATGVVYIPDATFTGSDVVVLEFEDYDRMGRVIQRWRTFNIAIP